MGNRNQKIWLDDVLLSIRGRIIERAVFSARENIYLSLSEEMPGQPPSDSFCVIVPGPQRPDQGVTAGADAETITAINGIVGVYLWTRISVDQEYRDDAYLTNPTLSALRTMRKLVAALQLYDPENSKGPILEEPMRMADQGFSLSPRQTKSGWGSIASAWETKYIADMSNTGCE